VSNPESDTIYYDFNKKLTWHDYQGKPDMNIPLVKNQKTSIKLKSLDAHTMVWDLIYMGSPTKLTELTYTKL
jgi:hypothetical protein